MTDNKAHLYSSLISFVCCIAFYIGMLNVGNYLVHYFNISQATINLCAIATGLMSYALILIMKKLSYKFLKEKSSKKKVSFKTTIANINHQTDFIFTSKNVKDLEVTK